MTVKLGVLGDSHISSGGAGVDKLEDKISELRDYIEPSLVWLLGDCITNITDYDISPCDVDYDPDITEAYKLVKSTMNKLDCEWVATPGNHDTRLDLFKEFLYPSLNVEKEINGIRFLTPNNEHRNNDTYLTESGNFRRWAREEVFAHLPPESMRWLKDKMESDPSIPTFVGFHEGLFWGFPDGDNYVTRFDTPRNHQMCQYGTLNYFCFDNRRQIRDILGIGNTIAVFQAHWQTTDWDPYEKVIDGISYFPKPHGGARSDYLLWVGIDEVNNTATVYWRYIPDHTDTEIATLSW